MLTMPACRYVNRVPKTSYCAAEAPPRKEDAYFFSVGPIEEGRNVILGQSLFELLRGPRHGRVAAGGLCADPGLRRGRLRVPAGRASSSLIRGGPSSPLSCVCAGRVHPVAPTVVAGTTRRSGLLQRSGSATGNARCYGAATSGRPPLIIRHWGVFTGRRPNRAGSYILADVSRQA